MFAAWRFYQSHSGAIYHIENMTERELQKEFKYRMEERLGILCEDREPTPDERKLAHKEAEEAVNKLRQEEGRLL